MTVTAKNLIQSAFAPSSAASMYISPNSTKTIIDSFSATNNTAGPVAISIFLVPSGGSHGNSNLISFYTISANSTQNMPEETYQVLEAGDSIWVLAGSASAIAVRASGRQITP